MKNSAAEVHKFAYSMLNRNVKNNNKYEDFQQAIEWLNDAGIEHEEFLDYTCKNAQGMKREVAELCMPAEALEYIACIAFDYGYGYTNASSDLKDSLRINGIASRFHIDPEGAGRALYEVREDARGAAWEFLRNMTNAEEPTQFLYAEIDIDSTGLYSITIYDTDREQIAYLDETEIRELLPEDVNVRDTEELGDALRSAKLIPTSAVLTDCICSDAEEEAV